jgi:Flp pilus assembly protein TadD
MTVELESEDARALADLGFIALSRGLDRHAAAIFEGLQAARPNEEAGFIGRALVDLARGDVESALRILRALPPSDAALTFLGMALIRHGDKAEARDTLGEVIRNDPDGSHGATAKAMLAELDSTR